VSHDDLFLQQNLLPPWMRFARPAAGLAAYERVLATGEAEGDQLATVDRFLDGFAVENSLATEATLAVRAVPVRATAAAARFVGEAVAQRPTVAVVAGQT
jgi:hypothetical protein